MSRPAPAGHAPHQLIAVYDAATGKRLAEFRPPPPPPPGPGRGWPPFGYIRVWLPAGAKHLFAASYGNTTSLLDPMTGRQEKIFDFGADAVEMTPDGVRLIRRRNETTRIDIHDEEGNLLRTLEHTDATELVGVDPAGTFVAAVGRKSEVRVWELATGKVLAHVAVPETSNQGMAVTVLAVTPDRRTLLAGTQSGAVYRFDIATGKELPALREQTGWLNSLLFADDGKTLVVTGWGHTLVRYDLASGKRLPDAGGYGGLLRTDQSPDRTLIAAGDTTGVLELLNGSTGERIRRLRESGQAGTSGVAFSPDGNLLASGHDDGYLRLWDMPTGKLVREVDIGMPAKSEPTWSGDIAFTPDGRRITICGTRIGMRMVDVETGKTIWHDASGYGHFAYLSGGRTIAGFGRDMRVVIRDAATGNVKSVLAEAWGYDLACSPDGKLLATGDAQGLFLRDPTTGAVRKKWQAHEPRQVTWGLSFGPGGIWLATGGDRTVKVWDTLTGKLLHKFEGHTSRAYGVQFASDGRTVLSHSMDLTGYVWDVRPTLDPAKSRTTEQLWEDLNGEPEAAFRAVWLAAADPNAPEVFGNLLPSPPKPDAENIKKLVERLGSDEFREREAAERELAKFGPAAFGLAKKAHTDSDSPEVRTRLDRVMKGWTEGTFAPEIWRRKRAVVAMQLAGTEAARKLLARWAADAPGTTLSDDAAAALKLLIAQEKK